MNFLDFRFYDYTPESGVSQEVVRNRARKYLKKGVAKNVDLEVESPNVLMVTHGGLIRELFIIIFNENGCDFPPTAKPGDHKKIVRNTSWSKFILDICTDTHDIKTIRCEVLGNSEHLIGIE